MNIYFAGQFIPSEILNNDELKDNESLTDIAGNSFYNNLLKGLKKNNCNITAQGTVYKNVIEKYGKKTCINGIDVSFREYKSNFIKRYTEMFFSVISNILRWKRKSKEKRVIIVNCLRIMQCIAAIIAAKITGTKIVAVVTDVPGYRPWSNKSGFVNRFTDKAGELMLGCYDRFVLLSEYMNPVVNKKDKPYIVIEGLNDTELFSEIDEDKYDVFTIMYAGSLMKKYNIMSLVDAVLKIDGERVKLLIYGGGELEEELKKISETDSRIEYRGKVPHSEILREEKRVHLLVNPRNSAEEYTKLSFPSKNIEYMLSGTPVLLTKLKSMPSEYYDCIYTIDDESADGICEKIREIMSLPEDELIKKGNAASGFIKEKKNNIRQTEKVKKLLEEVI